MDNIPEHFRLRIQEAKEKQLEKLDLSNKYRAINSNKLTIIPKEVFTLKHLKILDLSRNIISELPEYIDKLTSLSELNLGENKLTSLPESIGHLTNLTELSLVANKLTSLPESIGKLTNLTSLNLWRNQLTLLPESLGRLTSLNDLNLAVNNLESLPKSIGKLTNLTSLNLWRNQLTLLPSSLGSLTSLNKLNLGDNNLKTLPKSLGNLSNLAELQLSNNPIVEPPIEIRDRGTKSIVNYLRQIKEEGVDYIYEAKLLIVGEAGAGKTTLAKKIYNSNYQLKKEEKSTEGIEVIQWTFSFFDKAQDKQNFQVNVWDFGGQEIYHATHQFFLTKRSLYTLVADTRKEDTDFYYWLNVVELLSDNSPLLIVKNEKQDRKREINENVLRGQFTNLQKTLATNLATNRGLEEVLTNIKYYIQELPHIGDTLPKTWVKVRQTLENDSRSYIYLQEYLDICEKNGFKLPKDKLQLSQYLHDLGVCLHFQEEGSLLYKTVILKPEWGTEAVYKVLDNKQVINNQGCFTRNDLKNIWHEDKYALMRGELLELMKKFQLCYEIPSNKDTFIAPQLLSDNQPEYEWENPKNLILRYTYPDFMPKGIITRFIVVMHENIHQQVYVWKSGVILDKENTKAEVIEYYGKREIKIRVSGDNKRNFMTVVTHELDKINNSFKRLNYHKLIPCNCDKCKKSQSPHFYFYKTLQKFISKGQQYIQCQENFQMVNVFSLIDDAVDLNELSRSKYQEIDREKEFLKEIVRMQASRETTLEATFMASQGNTSSQQGNFGIGHMSGGKIEGNAKVAGVINEAEQQDLTQAAAEIQALLEQLSQTNPTTTNREKMAVAGEAVDIIETKPALKTKVINALKSGGTEAFKEAVNHPLVNVLVAMIEGWQEEY